MREAPMTIARKKEFELDHKRWSGGITTQLAIWPEDADYASRRFDWRISSAAVEDERSTFTPLPGVHRHIMTLGGEMTLTHEGIRTRMLKPLSDVEEFEGEWRTTSVGRCTDFNLMLRAGFRGRIAPLHAADVTTLPSAPSEVVWYGIYFTADAKATIRYDGYRAELSQERGDFVLISYRPRLCGDVTLSLSSSSSIPAVSAAVWRGI